VQHDVIAQRASGRIELREIHRGDGSRPSNFGSAKWLSRSRPPKLRCPGVDANETMVVIAG
jgi:hypothetical protein